MIEAKELSKRYGAFHALNDVSFSVGKGEVAGFLGLNGAGKTTTMRIISCYMPPTSGQVTVAGLDTVRESDAVRQKIGYLPERVPLYEDMRVHEYLRFRAKLKGVRGRAVKEKMDRVIGRCGLEPKRKALIRTLSKGYRQRVGFADSLVHEPALLILDEPTSGLDPDQRVEMRSLIREVGEERTVLLSTHILPEAEAVCDRIVVIHQGKIRTTGTLEELKRGKGRRRLTYSGAPLEEHRSRPGTERSMEGTVVFLDSDDEAASAVALVVNAGRAVRELVNESPSLERVFIEITTGRSVG